MPDLTTLIELSRLFNVTLDELVKQEEEVAAVRMVPQEERKTLEQMLFKVIIHSSDGDQIKIKLPMALVKVCIEIGAGFPGVDGKMMENIDLRQIMMLADSGVMGKLVELDSADGDHMEVFVE